MGSEGIYSEEIDKVCRLCVYSETVKGTKEHVRCTKLGGYVPIGHMCDLFEYDVFKRVVRRKKTVVKDKFTADDFLL
jgi:hypothetical protein